MGSFWVIRIVFSWFGSGGGDLPFFPSVGSSTTPHPNETLENFWLLQHQLPQPQPSSALQQLLLAGGVVGRAAYARTLNAFLQAEPPLSNMFGQMKSKTRACCALLDGFRHTKFMKYRASMSSTNVWPSARAPTLLSSVPTVGKDLSGQDRWLACQCGITRASAPTMILFCSSFFVCEPFLSQSRVL